jgi:hypothetical protein
MDGLLPSGSRRGCCASWWGRAPGDGDCPHAHMVRAPAEGVRLVAGTEGRVTERAEQTDGEDDGRCKRRFF